MPLPFYIFAIFLLVSVSVWIGARWVAAPNSDLPTAMKIAGAILALNFAFLFFTDSRVGRWHPTEISLFLCVAIAVSAIISFGIIKRWLGIGYFRTLAVFFVAKAVIAIGVRFLPEPIGSFEIPTATHKRQQSVPVQPRNAPSHAVLMSGVVVQTRYGSMELRKGMSLPVISRTADEVEVRTPDGRAAVLPVSSVRF